MTLPFDEAGAGPALVLLHAGVADRTMWRDQLEPLAAAGYRVIAPDLPGFGEARVLPGEQAPWNDVLETMAALGLAQAALVGNSYGGAVALRAAMVAPAAVSSLVLISTPPIQLADPSPELRAAWEAEEAALERGDIDAAVQAVVNAWTLPDAPAEMRERVADMQRRAFVLQAAASGAVEAPDPVDRDPGGLARLDLPALVMAGERDLPDFREGARALAGALPNARHESVAGAGHLAPIETPGTFRKLLLEFLARPAS